MTGHIIPLRGDGHNRAQALLPWYVSGRLDSDERAEVEAHLADCAECQAELKIERRLNEAVAAAPTAGALHDVEHGWASMHRRINAGPGGEAAPRRMRPTRLWLGAGRIVASPWIAGPVWMRWALGGQLALSGPISPSESCGGRSAPTMRAWWMAQPRPTPICCTCPPPSAAPCWRGCARSPGSNWPSRWIPGRRLDPGLDPPARPGRGAVAGRGGPYPGRADRRAAPGSGADAPSAGALSSQRRLRRQLRRRRWPRRPAPHRRSPGP
jgi:hypothetical protein